LDDVPRNKSFADAASLLRSLLCETLCNFITKHGVRARTFLVANNILPRMLKLLNARDKFLHLASIRVIRAVLTTSNRFYFTYVVESNLLEPIVKLFISNGSKYNLINSAIIDLFETVRKVPMNSSLLRYYLERFHDRLKDIDYVNTFQQLRVLAESGGRTPDTPDDSASPAVPKPTVHDGTREQYRKKILEEQHEDAWFSKDDDLSHAPNGYESSDSEKEADNVISAMATGNLINVASPTPPVPPPLTLERMEEDLFPEILQDIEKKRKREDDDLDNFFESLARPNKKSKGNSE
jgi:protein phosphatase-4 regulatory subunit 3